VNFALGKSVRGPRAPEYIYIYIYIYSVAAQKTAKHRARFGWPPVSDVAAVTNQLKFAGCPKPPNRSQPLVGRSSSHFGDLWKEILLFNKFFFRLSIHALVAKMQHKKVVRLCPDAELVAIFCVLYFR